MAPVVEDTGAKVSAVPQARKARHANVVGAVVADTRDTVRSGEISEELAEQVWRDCRKIWGVSVSDSSDRDVFSEKLAIALVESTSGTDDNLDTKFKVGGVYYNVRVIHDVMLKYVDGRGSMLRVFVRSYNGAFFALKMFLTLKNPLNVEMRQAMAFRLGGNVAHAPYMLDVFEAVLRHSGTTFTSHEVALGHHYSKMRTAQAQQRATAVGMETTVADEHSRLDKAVVADPVAPAPAAAEGTRLRFAAMR